MKNLFLYIIAFFLLLSVNGQCSDSSKNSQLKLIKTITGRISPKSIVHNGNGMFFAQNMMYKHTITVYNRNHELIATIKDKIKLSKFEEDTLYHSDEYHRGAPVECVFTHDGKFAWISNYEMTGKGFNHPGCDNCKGKNEYDHSYIYKINTENFKIEHVIKVGSVPKFMAATKDNKFVLVSNWTSSDLSIIDTEQNVEIKRINVGRFPRGIAIDNTKNIAYVAIMGSDKIAKIDLKTYNKSFFEVGEHPRHLCIDEYENNLFVTLNGEGKIAKVNLNTNYIEKLRTGKLPRSMAYCDYNKSLYVVNYGSKYLSKVDTKTFKITDTILTKSKPIGVTLDKTNGEVWIACYSGSVMVVKDHSFQIKPKMGPFEMDYNLNQITEKVEKKNTIKSNKNKLEETRYFIIVGSFKEKENAKKLSQKLKSKHPNSSYFKNSNGFYYVFIDDFTSKDDAKKFINQEKNISSEFNGWILKN